MYSSTTRQVYFVHQYGREENRNRGATWKDKTDSSNGTGLAGKTTECHKTVMRRCHTSYLSSILTFQCWWHWSLWITFGSGCFFRKRSLSYRWKSVTRKYHCDGRAGRYLGIDFSQLFYSKHCRFPVTKWTRQMKERLGGKSLMEWHGIQLLIEKSVTCSDVKGDVSNCICSSCACCSIFQLSVSDFNWLMDLGNAINLICWQQKYA